MLAAVPVMSAGSDWIRCSISPKSPAKSPLAISAGNCALLIWRMKPEKRCGPTWKRSATRFKLAALLSSSHNAPAKLSDVLVIDHPRRLTGRKGGKEDGPADQKSCDLSNDRWPRQRTCCFPDHRQRS